MFILKFINDYISDNRKKKTTNVVLNEEEVEKEEKIEEKNEKEKKEVKQKPKNNVKTISNIDQIFKVRINNVLAKADKTEKKIEEENFNKLNDYTFDPNFGYLVCNLLDGKVRVASKDILLISFEYDSAIEQNKFILEKLESIYKKVTNSNKKIVLVSDSEWKNIKAEFIENLKNKKEYNLLDEPKAVYEELDKDDIIGNAAVDLFGDIVEIEE